MEEAGEQKGSFRSEATSSSVSAGADLMEKSIRSSVLLSALAAPFCGLV